MGVPEFLYNPTTQAVDAYSRDWLEAFETFTDISATNVTPEGGGYGQRHIVNFDQGVNLSYIVQTESEINRARIEASPLTIGNNIITLVSSKALTIVKYGNYTEGVKSPAGTTHLDGAQRWQDENLASRTKAFAKNKDLDWISYSTEKNKVGQADEQQIEHEYTFINGGVYTRSTITKGDSEGRVIARYYPDDFPANIYTRECLAVKVGYRVGYGIIVEQGKNQNRTPSGSTHYFIAPMLGVPVLDVDVKTK